MTKKILSVVCSVLVASGAFGQSTEKFQVAWGGGACEAPVLAAYYNGFFKQEGLDVELVKVPDFESEKTALASNKISGAVGNFGWFKAIEQGFAVKLTGGIHAGCIKFVTPQGSAIKTLADVKGKTIGIDAIGSGPQIDLSIALRNAGINPKTEVSWRAYPPTELSAAVKKKEIDAFIVWDPFAAFAVQDEKYNTLLDIAKDEPFKSGYCCFVVVSALLVKNDPKKAAAYTKAILRGAKWVGENPDKAAALEVDNKFVPGEKQQIADLLASYYWRPSVSHAKDVAKYFITEQKKDGILEATTNEAKLLDRLFATVVTDAEVNL